MNCIGFTSGNGDRNGKRKYGAADCGARAKQHHNSSIDFLSFGWRRRKTWSSQTRMRYELAPFFADFATTETVWEPVWSSTSILSSRRLRQKLRQQHD
jgi:hypothetical protein